MRLLLGCGGGLAPLKPHCWASQQWDPMSDPASPPGARAMYKVKNAMNRKVISISPDATVEEAIHLLLDHSISGAPVIDDEGELCGIITQFQLLEVMYDPNVKNTRIRDCMTRGVFTIDEDALLGKAANLLVIHRIRRIPVVKGRRVVGIISRRDLLQYFVDTGEEIQAFFSKLKQTSAHQALAV